MKLKDYLEQVRLHIKEYLPGEFQNAEVLIQQQRKNNGLLLHGMALKAPDMSMSPVVYLEDYYKLYQNGTAVADTFRFIGKAYLTDMDNIKNLQTVDFSYDHMKNNLFLCVVNAERNQKLLVNVPHRRIEDLAVVYRCMVHPIENGLGSVLVDNNLFASWGIEKDTLHKQALQNMNCIFTPEFHSMEYILAKKLGLSIRETETMLNNSDMFVLSNSQEYHGASYLCCPEILQWVSEKMKGSYLILPSSVHEVIILRELEDINLSELQDMVSAVNRTEVSQDEYLSDRVYRYDSQTQDFAIITDTDMQQGMNLLQ